MKKIVLGLSGGVDSAVSAKLLREQGYEVHGLYMDVGLGGLPEAQRVADALGIPLYAAHRESQFEQEVQSYFAHAYQTARTPNPCVVCNRKVKFTALCQYADEIGAAQVATGHYARIGRDAEGRALLMRARSPKDQSYMLANLPRSVLERCVFPLGEAADKAEVRALARENQIPVADKKDSMDVCFISGGDYSSWLEARGAALPEGNFVDEAGNILGRHKGLHHYTVGQRKGLGVAASGRLFVHELRQDTNEVVLSLNDVFREQITVQGLNLCAPEYAESGGFDCQARVRYSKSSERAHVTVHGDGSACVTFAQAVRAPAAGQFAAFYDGDIVIGGGFIDG